jgi:hypothetical protein
LQKTKIGKMKNFSIIFFSPIKKTATFEKLIFWEKKKPRSIALMISQYYHDKIPISKTVCVVRVFCHKTLGQPPEKKEREKEKEKKKDIL